MREACSCIQEEGTDKVLTWGMERGPGGGPAAPGACSLRHEESGSPAPITPMELPGRETEDTETRSRLSAKHLPLMT